MSVNAVAYLPTEYVPAAASVTGPASVVVVFVVKLLFGTSRNCRSRHTTFMVALAKFSNPRNR